MGHPDDTDQELSRWSKGPCGFWCLFVAIGVIISLYAMFLSCHLYPSWVEEDPNFWGWAIAFHAFFIPMLFCYVKCVVTDPGGVPKTQEWDYDAPEGMTPVLREHKGNGERRHCKWCGHYKPDRCHHCRKCHTCVLKMDHHCPWIHNCVGFRNHKVFLLLNLYTLCTLGVWLVTVLPRVFLNWGAVDSWPTLFLQAMGSFIALLLTVLLSGFLSFHLWLVVMAMTTIEYLEKRQSANSGARYRRGPLQNLKDVFGPSMFLWLLPCTRVEGDGLFWESDQLSVDVTRRQRGTYGSSSLG